MTVSPAYLDGAEEAGLLSRHQGLPFVAGGYDEPVTGERQFLVTHCDPELVRRPAWWSELVRLARRADPAAEAIVLRVPGDVSPPAPWRRLITYLRHEGRVEGAPTTADDTPVSVLPATAEHRPLIARWLATALTAAADAHGSPGRSAPPDVVDSLLDAPGRASYVVVDAGTVIGHATLLDDTYDDVTGRHTVELFDILVEAGDGLRRRATTALTAVAAAHAADRDLPLLGNVVHSPTLTSDPGERVVATLTARGWLTDHVLWRLALPPEPTGTAAGAGR
ncbi:hypothetical protein [Streptomyces cucumeris]|uniref:hypothetical protein n=1 Tax=Streptomyces cucumeris TaxID=2962890 RepID=UPI003D75A69E